MPTGKVKWYDADKGFGFLSQEDGEDVYVRSSALPEGVEDLKAGQKVEFGLASGRRGPQALSVTLVDAPPSLTRTRREAAAAEHKHTPDELHGMVEDMISLLEGAVQPELRKGRYPDRKIARRVSEVVQAVARELDAESSPVPTDATGEPNPTPTAPTSRRAAGRATHRSRPARG